MRMARGKGHIPKISEIGFHCNSGYEEKEGAEDNAQMKSKLVLSLILNMI